MLLQIVPALLQICIALLQSCDLLAQTDDVVLERPAIRLTANRRQPRNLHPISDPPPAATPAILQVNRFVVIPGLHTLLVVADDLRDSLEVRQLAQYPRQAAVQVVDLRLLLGEVLLMAQEASCASLPVPLVAFRVLRGHRGGSRSPTHPSA